MPKAEAYNLGLYSFPVPGPCTAGWSDSEWIRFIDARGRWHVEVV